MNTFEQQKVALQQKVDEALLIASSEINNIIETTVQQISNINFGLITSFQNSGMELDSITLETRVNTLQFVYLPVNLSAEEKEKKIKEFVISLLNLQDLESGIPKIKFKLVI